ncbi:protein containing MTH538 TIR-like domain [Lentimicrobium saccharophilum]|uniref:Protein containing MTH538 TIR-like domain n=1 Tax=Lentimicrobium saccharophilum TaxID=1678841 RepID=A0A0S7BTQ5_9BACT|nr:TIR domain-containing protein [Lentimicrobium saccharophilum]GAP44252.1 protein containing MTH538 TIR-like domain [Lentimicrobium saccharophilum]
MANKEYLVTRLSFREDGRLIRDVTVYEYDGQSLDNGTTQNRQWMVNKVTAGYQISIMTPNPDVQDEWKKHNPFSYNGGYFSWEFKLPLNETKRKTFVSYYHRDNQGDRARFANLFGDLIVSKSVEDGDIDSDNSDEYIKQLIQKEYLSDTTVLVVLIGPKTKCRMHVDWEISGALNLKVGESNAGLLGILLPSHPDYGTGQATYDLMPARLADNVKSGYAIIRDWTDDRVKVQEYIEEAFERRISMADKRTNSRLQMDKDTCE